MKLKLFALIGGDFLLAVFAFFAALVSRYGYREAVHSLSGSVPEVIIFTVAVMLPSYIFELYSLEKNRRKREIVINIVIAVSVSFILLLTVFFIDPRLMMPRGMLITSLTIFMVLQFGWHALYMLGHDHPGLTERILIIGTGTLALRVGDLIEKTKTLFNHELAGYVSCESDNDGVAVPPELVVGAATDLLDVAQKNNSLKIIVCLTERRGIFPLRDTLRCKLNGMEVIDSPTFYEQVTGRLMLENINPSWLIFSSGFKRTASFSAFKRFLDICFSLVGIIISLPLFPIIALLVKLDSPGPIFFSQIRIGNWEKKFRLYKFRTMPQDAEAKTGAMWAQKDDPRIRPIGRFLRKYRFDEIPQLYNVLKGDMSLVGPRPERPEFVERLKQVVPYYSKRHFVKSGVTGWAQVKYPYGASVEDALEKLRYDLFYIKNMSLHLEGLIILETLKVVLFSRGGR